MEQQRVDQRASVMPGGRMHHHARRLVDNDDVGILMADHERDVLRLRQRLLQIGHAQGDAFARFHLARGIDLRLAGDIGMAGLDHRLDAAARERGHKPGQRLVEPHPGLGRCDLKVKRFARLRKVMVFGHRHALSRSSAAASMPSRAKPADCSLMSPKDNLTGVWHGLYSYPVAVEPVYFMATLISSGTMLSGMTHEAVKGRKGAPLTVFAALDGSRSGQAIEFIKTYDGTGGWRHSVRYEGTLNTEATEIEGFWMLSTGWIGRFLMIRSAGMTEEVARKVYERA